MKVVVKYTVYFTYEDPFWDTAADEMGSGEDHLRYCVEEHNCHDNYVNMLYRSLEKAEDDICNSGTAEIVTEWPKDIQPYEVTK